MVVNMIKLFLLFLVPVFSSFGQGTMLQYEAYLITKGYAVDEIPRVFSSRRVELLYQNNGLWVPIKWNIPIPAPQELPSLEESSVILSDAKAAYALAKQASKPLEQRQYENRFFALTEQLFNLTGITNDVTPKLGFPELQAKIEQIQATDPMTAVNLSLKLLTIDSALKRYDTLWWDDAIQHELPEN